MAAFTDKIEETLMAFLLFTMTALTFANVVARYAFNANILWALEATVYLFAWLVLFGACYGVKKNLHIGVDIVTAHLPPRWQFASALLAAVACVAFAAILFIASVSYWYPFIAERAWLEVNDIPMPNFLRFLEGWLNEGEAYEKMPRFIPYAVLPLSTGLLLSRFCIASIEILQKKRRGLIATHEVETIFKRAE